MRRHNSYKLKKIKRRLKRSTTLGLNYSKKKKVKLKLSRGDSKRFAKKMKKKESYSEKDWV